MIRVYIRDNFMRGGIDVFVVNHIDGKALLYTSNGERSEWVDASEDTGIRPLDVPPTIQLPLQYGAQVAQSLAEHFGTPLDATALRKDYEAERARVDKMIDNLISPAS